MGHLQEMRRALNSRMHMGVTIPRMKNRALSISLVVTTFIVPPNNHTLMSC